MSPSRLVVGGVVGGVVGVVVAVAGMAVGGTWSRIAEARPVAPAGAGGREGVGDRGPQVSCVACIVVDDRGTVLWARREALRLPNASTTKIVTALTLTRAYDVSLDAPVEVSPVAAATSGGGLGLQPHEVLPVRSLLLALLLTSSNDAAVALAEHAAGGAAAFVATMNRVAAELGAKDTHFVTPHGLDAPGHLSSARDLARFGADLLSHPSLARMVARPVAKIPGPGGAEVLENSNPLLESYPGAVGIKTGFTSGSGEVLVGAARRRGRTLVAVAMRAADASRDARALLDYGFARLARAVMVPRGATVGEMVFDAVGAAPVVSGREIRGWAPRERAEVRFVPGDVSLPVAKGEPVGRVEVTWRGRLLGGAPAVAGRTVRAAEPSRLAEHLGGLLESVYRALSALGARVR